MNVIVSNRQKEILDNANIDAIKDLNGLFSVDDLVNKFKNYFFSKMILDATSVVNFATREVLQKLADEIGPDRLIILLPSSPEPPEEFKKMLIELKIYNFSNNIDDVVKFIDNPNTYESVINANPNSYAGNNYYVDSSIKDSGLEYDLSTNDEGVSSNINNYNIPDNHSSFDDIMSHMNINENINVISDGGNSQTDSMVNNVVNEDQVSNNDLSNLQNVYDIQTNDNFSMKQNDSSMSNNIGEVKTDSGFVSADNSTNKTYTFLNMDGFDSPIDNSKPPVKRVIGFKNITLHAGSTTLIYMLEKEAQKKNSDVVSIEINKNDFKLFRNSKMISVKEEDFSNALNSLKESVILVDLNDCSNDSICNEVVYLVEPSTIKLNELMMVNKDIFATLRDKKVILNQSMLSSNDVPILEKEAGIKFFYNMGSVNDRVDNMAVTDLFEKLIKYQ